MPSEEKPAGLRSARLDAGTTPGDFAVEETDLPATIARLPETPADVQQIDIYIRAIDADGQEIAFYSVEIDINCREMTTYSPEIETYTREMASYIHEIDTYSREMTTYSREIDAYALEIESYRSEMTLYAPEITDYSLEMPASKELKVINSLLTMTCEKSTSSSLFWMEWLGRWSMWPALTPALSPEEREERVPPGCGAIS